MLKFAAPLAAIALVWTATSAQAADFRKFDQANFEQMQTEGRPILVDVAAAWCPTCRAQEPILKQAAAAKEFDNLVVYRLDFDKQKAERRALGAQKQSTLIAYKGAKETARSVGDTDPTSITALLKTTID
jgi:thioredoxin 1